MACSKQRHSALWRRKSKSEVHQPSVHNEAAAGSEHEQKEEEEQDSVSLEEESSNEEEERDVRKCHMQFPNWFYQKVCLFLCLCHSQVFDEQMGESVPDTHGADTATSNPLITVQESDKVRTIRGQRFKFITFNHFKGLADVNVVFFTIAQSLAHHTFL